MEPLQQKPLAVASELAEAVLCSCLEKLSKSETPFVVKVENGLDAFNRACAQRLITLSQDVSIVDPQSVKPSALETQEGISKNTTTFTTIIQNTTCTHSLDATYTHTSHSNSPSAARWFDERKNEAKNLLLHLFQLIQRQSGQRDLCVCVDLRGLSVEVIGSIYDHQLHVCYQ